MNQLDLRHRERDFLADANPRIRPDLQCPQDCAVGSVEFCYGAAIVIGHPDVGDVAELHLYTSNVVNVYMCEIAGIPPFARDKGRNRKSVPSVFISGKVLPPQRQFPSRTIIERFSLPRRSCWVVHPLPRVGPV